ncbi:MAG TPA: hypothetical protein VKW04_14180 [Planctomycetota bacterium]|nr:hypothetical protein [Planctomycetota bacterium]
MRLTTSPPVDRIRGVLLQVALVALACRSASAQGLSDLVGQNAARTDPAPSGDLELRLGRGRVDLGLSPTLRPVLGPERKTVSLSAQADLRMICGQYDLKASFQHLLGREAREEFLEGILGTLVHELVGSGMDLLCQAEPTVCTLLQNHSVSANLKLGYYKDLCQAIETAAVDSQKKAYATAVDQCLKDQKDEGVPIDRAIDLCQKKPAQLTGFRGEALGELDLGKELHGLFQGMGLTPGTQKLAERLSDDTKLGTRSVAADLDPSAVPRLFDDAQADYAKRLNDILSQASTRQPLATADLRALVPSGAAPITEDEIRNVARLSPREQAVVVGSISSALAVFEMGDQIRELERAIEVLKGAPTTDEGNRKLLEDRLARLRAEKNRLIERFRDQELVMRAVASAKGLAEQELARRVATLEAQAGEPDRKRDLLNETRSYGTLPTQTTGSAIGASPSSSCEGCGLNVSFGSYGAQK